MIYSGGLPLLYPLAALSFLAIYWSDKYLLLRSYRKPPLFDNKIALPVLRWFKYALLGHFIISIWMYSNNSIFPIKKPKM